MCVYAHKNIKGKNPMFIFYCLFFFHFPSQALRVIARENKRAKRVNGGRKGRKYICSRENQVARTASAT